MSSHEDTEGRKLPGLWIRSVKESRTEYRSSDSPFYIRQVYTCELDTQWTIKLHCLMRRGTMLFYNPQSPSGFHTANNVESSSPQSNEKGCLASFWRCWTFTWRMGACPQPAEHFAAIYGPRWSRVVNFLYLSTSSSVDTLSAIKTTQCQVIGTKIFRRPARKYSNNS